MLSGKYNAGEKGWFWVGVTTCGLLVSVCGLFLLVPNWVPQREWMQLAHFVHSIVVVGFICLGFGNIYLDTIRMQGPRDLGQGAPPLLVSAEEVEGPGARRRARRGPAGRARAGRGLLR